MADFETPEYREFDEIPALKPDIMAHSSPFVAKPEHQEPLDFPGELVDDWHDKAIAKLGELTNKFRGLKVFLDSCVKCGSCTDKCHYFIGTHDPKNMPVARQDLLPPTYKPPEILLEVWKTFFPPSPRFIHVSCVHVTGIFHSNRSSNVAIL